LHSHVASSFEVCKRATALHKEIHLKMFFDLPIGVEMNKTRAMQSNNIST